MFFLPGVTLFAFLSRCGGFLSHQRNVSSVRARSKMAIACPDPPCTVVPTINWLSRHPLLASSFSALSKSNGPTDLFFVQPISNFITTDLYSYFFIVVDFSFSIRFIVPGFNPELIVSFSRCSDPKLGLLHPAIQFGNNWPASRSRTAAIYRVMTMVVNSSSCSAVNQLPPMVSTNPDSQCPG